MERLNIICVDDQREVLRTLMKDIEEIAEYINVEECESAEEAWELMEEIEDDGDYVALIISDHVMPGKNGVDFLIEVNNDSRFISTKKVLLTGLATQKETISAINNAGIDNYFEKPWKGDSLLTIIKKLLTIFIIEKGMEYMKYTPILDQPTLYAQISHKML